LKYSLKTIADHLLLHSCTLFFKFLILRISTGNKDALQIALEKAQADRREKALQVETLKNQLFQSSQTIATLNNKLETSAKLFRELDTKFQDLRKINSDLESKNNELLRTIEEKQELIAQQEKEKKTALIKLNSTHTLEMDQLTSVIPEKLEQQQKYYEESLKLMEIKYKQQLNKAQNNCTKLVKKLEEQDTVNENKQATTGTQYKDLKGKLDKIQKNCSDISMKTEKIFAEKVKEMEDQKKAAIESLLNEKTEEMKKLESVYKIELCKFQKTQGEEMEKTAAKYSENMKKLEESLNEKGERIRKLEKLKMELEKKEREKAEEMSGLRSQCDTMEEKLIGKESEMKRIGEELRREKAKAEQYSLDLDEKKKMIACN
jgi:hypothetical protein